MNNGLYNVGITVLLTEMKCNQLLVKETFFFTIYCLKRQLLVFLFPHITFLVTVIVACSISNWRLSSGQEQSVTAATGLPNCQLSQIYNCLIPMILSSLRHVVRDVAQLPTTSGK